MVFQQKANIMARPKGAKNKTTKKPTHDPNVEEIVEEWVEFTCPKRGKVRQKVKIKRLKAMSADQRSIIGAKDMIDDLESKEDDISAIETDPED
jgi:hypothetical protein